MPACEAPPPADVAERASPLEQEADAVDEAGCVHPDAPEPLRIALEDGDEPGQIRDLARAGELRIVVTNDSSQAGTVLLRARVTSRAGFRDDEIAQLEVGAGESIPVGLTAADLSLPAGDFDFSGNLTIEGTLTFDAGERTNAVELDLHFHPVRRGWQVYDTAAFETDFDGGALTDAARLRRAEAAAVSAERSRLGHPVSIVAVDTISEGGAR